MARFKNSMLSASLMARKTFRREQGGSVAIIFALSASLLCTLVAGGVELHRRNLAISLMQTASDAAALAAKRAESDALVTVDRATARLRGEAAGLEIFRDSIGRDAKVFGANLPNPTFSWLTDDSVKVATTGNVDTIFSGFLPASFSSVATSATVNYGVPLPTEVALVLDNTASMFNRDGRPQTRFTQLRDAAKLFTHTLFNAAEELGNSDWLRISVVPWATTVNVLGEAPRTPDPSGNAAIVSIQDKGSQIAVTAPLSRTGRVNVNTANFAPVGWRGCISGSTESQAPTDAGGMNWTALAVPQASLDTTVIGQGDMLPVTRTVCDWVCRDDGNANCGGGGGGGGGGSGPSGFYDLLRKAVPNVSNATFFGDRQPRTQGGAKPQLACQVCNNENCRNVTNDELVCGNANLGYISCDQTVDYGQRNPYFNSGTVCAPSGQGCVLRNTQVTQSYPNGCAADPNEPKVINGTVPWCPWAPTTNWNSLTPAGFPEPTAGPNLNCPSPMLGLSGNRRQIIQTIDRMTPVTGGTHADVGLRWGLRTVSPNSGWPGFFGLTKPPVAYGGAEKKVMILITDGENAQAKEFPGYWGCEGYANPGCVSAPKPNQLDSMMQSWCDYIRVEKKIELFTIAVNFSNPAAVNRLERCAGDKSHAFSVDASQLKNVLNLIAGTIMRLRITS